MRTASFSSHADLWKVPLYPCSKSTIKHPPLWLLPAVPSSCSFSLGSSRHCISEYYLLEKGENSYVNGIQYFIWNITIELKSCVILKVPIRSNIFIYLWSHFKLEHALSTNILVYILSSFFQLGQWNKLGTALFFVCNFFKYVLYCVTLL